MISTIITILIYIVPLGYLIRKWAEGGVCKIKKDLTGIIINIK